MKHIMMATAFAVAMSLTAFSQTQPPSSQPSSTNPATMPQTQSPDMAPSGSASPAADNKAETKGDKKIKGCLQSAGGKFMIEDKHGKQVALAGSQDFASHVGHTVTAHGAFANGADASSAASASTTGGAASADQFMVTKLDMVSESCAGEKGKTGKDKDSDHDNMSKPNPNHK